MLNVPTWPSWARFQDIIEMVSAHIIWSSLESSGVQASHAKRNPTRVKPGSNLQEEGAKPTNLRLHHLRRWMAEFASGLQLRQLQVALFSSPEESKRTKSLLGRGHLPVVWP